MHAVVAFTGSANKLTELQKLAIRQRVMSLPKGTIVVTGGCIGVDAYVAEIASNWCALTVITILPENRSKVDPNWREHCQTYEDLPRTYEQRNIRMVELCSLLIGYPERESNGVDRGSGSWMTLRIAKRMGREIECFPLSQI